MQEIERKFLVASDGYKEEAFESHSIKQGFLNRDPARTVRVRIKDQKGFLTIKGKSSGQGLSRFEWEREIPLREAEALFELCEPGSIEKTRYLVQSGKHVVEVDEFHAENKGLVMAEIELGSEEEAFQKPEWLREEVTGQKKYYNSQLSQNPYTNWK